MKFFGKKNGYQPKGQNLPPKPPITGTRIKNTGKILSDITKRELIVEGIDRVKAIDLKNNGKDLFSIEILGDNLFKVILTKRVGSFYNTREIVDVAEVFGISE